MNEEVVAKQTTSPPREGWRRGKIVAQLFARPPTQGGAGAIGGRVRPEECLCRDRGGPGRVIENE